MVSLAVTPKFSVSEFLAVVNQSLELAFGSVQIEGEVSSFKVNHQKYVFFDLKDDDGTVNCFMTVWQLRLPIHDGMRVVVRAVPKVTDWGKFSLTVQSVQPVGEGNLRKSFELLRKKLSDEGLFDDARKRLLPSRPQYVAVISSTNSAGYADFMKIANERWGGVRFSVVNVMVQGDTAADQIIRAVEKIESLADLPEVIVVIRGGGSADDLSVFNDELLVRKLASSRVPVLTGIGHEIDTTLCDLAADVRASTPSNAAQLLLPDKQEMIRSIKHQLRGVALQTVRAIDEELELVQAARSQALNSWRQRVDELLGDVQLRIRLISEYDPELALARGYAMIRGNCAVGEVIEIQTNKALMKARIEEYAERSND